MTDIDDSEKPDSSRDDTKGIFEKYEMEKLNKYVVVITIQIMYPCNLI